MSPPFLILLFYFLSFPSENLLTVHIIALGEFCERFQGIITPRVAGGTPGLAVVFRNEGPKLHPEGSVEEALQDVLDLAG